MHPMTARAQTYAAWDWLQAADDPDWEKRLEDGWIDVYSKVFYGSINILAVVSSIFHPDYPLQDHDVQ